MQRQTKEIKLPLSGYTAHVATFWTWADRQALTRAVIKDQKIDQKSAKDMQEGNVSINAENAIDYQFEALKRAVIKLVNPEGVEESPEDVVNLPEDDVDLLVEAVRAIGEAVKKN